MTNPIIGVIGVGVVGSAIVQAFRDRSFSVIAYDKFKPGFTDDEIHFDALTQTEAIFVSVPTLTNSDGTQDHGPLEDVIKRIQSIHYSGVVAVKCTTLPGTMKGLRKRFSKLRLVHYPEFLTEANALDDFKYQKAALLSGKEDDCRIIYNLLRAINPILAYRHYHNYETTEVAKYTHNCFLALKLSFLNEIYDFCHLYEVSYPDMIEGVSLMEKIGPSHLAVPGPDGQKGWGGMCFLKDTKAFASLMRILNINAYTLDAAIHSNSKRRRSW